MKKFLLLATIAMITSLSVFGQRSAIADAVAQRNADYNAILSLEEFKNMPALPSVPTLRSMDEKSKAQDYIAKRHVIPATGLVIGKLVSRDSQTGAQVNPNTMEFIVYAKQQDPQTGEIKVVKLPARVDVPPSSWTTRTATINEVAITMEILATGKVHYSATLTQ